MNDIKQRREYDEWIRRRHAYKPKCEDCRDSGVIPVDVLFTALGVRKCPFCQQQSTMNNETKKTDACSISPQDILDEPPEDYRPTMRLAWFEGGPFEEPTLCQLWEPDENERQSNYARCWWVIVETFAFRRAHEQREP